MSAVATIRTPAVCPVRRLQMDIGDRNAEILRILRRAENGRGGGGSLTNAQRQRLGVLRAEVAALRSGADVPMGRRSQADEDETE